MTSKNLCFKLMKEDLKRRVWTLALTILGLLFSMLIPIAIKSGELKDLPLDSSPNLKRILIHDIITLLENNGFMVTVLLTAAVLWAVSGFQYLHNSRKVDFYHSIPVKRHQLFLVKYVNGIVIPALIYLAVLIPSVITAHGAGISASVIGTGPWQAYLFHMVYYSLMYTTVVLAMMLTGNVVVALLGTVVFCGYGPMVIGLCYEYFLMWFQTFYLSKEQERHLLRLLLCSSPFSSYMGFLSDFGSGNFDVIRLIKAVLVTLVLAAGCCVLYQRRPSEAAGKAMAFKKTQMPIKVLIVIPVSIAFGMVFYALRSTVAWLVFGTLCGCVLTHCIMEIIYHFDFRKLFSNRIPMAACGLVSVVLMTAGCYDWYGYDVWIPDSSKVESASVVFEYHDDWVSYGHVEKTKQAYWANYGYMDNMEQFYGDDDYYYWSSMPSTAYAFEHMNLSDVSSIIALAEKGVEAQRQGNTGDSYYDSECYTIQYHMKNGKKVQRQYLIENQEDVIELYRSIHDREEYKEGTYPLLEQTLQDTAKVYFQQYNHRQEVALDEETRGILLETYQKEWKNLTMETREKELPVGTIQFCTYEMEEANSHNAFRDRDGLISHNFYPVYPSFTETLGILGSHGVDFIEFTGENLSKISIYYYQISERGDVEEITRSDLAGKRVSYEEEEEIEALAPALCFTDYYRMGDYYQANVYNGAEVLTSLKGTYETINCLIDLNKLSSQAAKKYGFDTVAE